MHTCTAPLRPPTPVHSHRPQSCSPERSPACAPAPLPRPLPSSAWQILDAIQEDSQGLLQGIRASDPPPPPPPLFPLPRPLSHTHPALLPAGRHRGTPWEAAPPRALRKGQTSAPPPRGNPRRNCPHPPTPALSPPPSPPPPAPPSPPTPPPPPPRRRPEPRRRPTAAALALASSRAAPASTRPRPADLHHMPS